jgi:uncharacterized membrane protein YhaH (DUF805 family)
MKLRLGQFTSWKGEITRGEYLTAGLVLFGIKYNLDRLIAIWFNKSWFITDYFIQADKLAVTELGENDRLFFIILLAQSLPFIWFGTVLCVKRLRNAKLPGWLVIFFFIPFINFILFIILAAIPSNQAESHAQKKYLSKLIPTSKFGSAVFSVGIVTMIGLAITGLFINYLNEYGWSLFVGVPFLLGFGSVLLYGHQKHLTYRESLGVAFTSVLFFGSIVFLLAFEGIICILMAFPIFLGVAFIGATIGYSIQNSQRPMAMNTFALPILAIIASGYVEHNNDSSPPTTKVVTHIIINAPKQTVWNQLVAFSEIEEPTELLFKTGIAYPIHAEINGQGAGAIRKCNFTTGPFIEPITVWDEPNILQFGVIDQPPPMVEWSIYRDLKIPHIDGYFRSEKGQFRLEELASGQTKLTGTTWYHHNVWPSNYWKLWSDYILHRIHTRVLVHIKNQAENGK